MNAHGSLAGRRVTVMGLGLFGGGAAVVRYLAARGARVTATDLRGADELAECLAQIEGAGARLVLGEHRAQDFAEADLVVANPAVAPGSRFLQLARTSGVPVTSETALFLEICPARVAAVTGTQGKSSTCRILATLLEESGLRTHLGGNIGVPLLERAEDMAPEDVVVLELSSYQLEALPPDGPRPAAAVAITNVLADHLERHGSIEAYAAAKRRVLELLAEGGTALLPGADARCGGWLPPDGRGVVRFHFEPHEREPCLDDAGFRWGEERLAAYDDLPLPGAFQRENALVALALARALGVPSTQLAPALRRVRGLAHRLEDLGRHGGRRVWDNGVSTTPDSTVSALRALGTGFVLICGGRAKELALDELAREAARRTRGVACFGQDAPRLAAAFAAAGARVEVVADLESSVRAAYSLSRAGDAILFSPACASFDAYRNFADRARAFRAALPESDADPQPEASPG